jgi:predicted CoA-binding protein
MLSAKRIAIVGLSDDSARASYAIGEYLLEQGYEVAPVNPNHREVMGMKCYASLKDVPGAVDLVNVFRRPEYCAQVAREAIEVWAKGIWLQSGIRNAQARQAAEAAGIDYVEDRCIMVEHLHRARRGIS